MSLAPLWQLRGTSLRAIGIGRILPTVLWRKDGIKELVTFAFDEKDRMVGLIEQPMATLDHEELQFHIEVVAKECDRFEYALTGANLQ